MRAISIINIIAIFAIGLVTTAHAQQIKKLSLDEAIKLTIENSGKLKIANAKVAEAVAYTKEQTNNRLPDVKMSGSYLRLNTPTIDLKLNQNNTDQGGGTPEVHQLAFGMVNGSLPLFAGFRINSGIESAKYLEKATKLDADKDKEEIIENTIASYSNLYKAERAIQLVKENIAREKSRVGNFTNLEKNGLLAKNDLLKAQLQLSNIELSLMEAESSYKIAAINMNLMLGLPENTVLETDSSTFKILNDPGTVTTWVDAAYSNRKDKAALAARIKASEIGIKAVKGEYYPTLALTGGYVMADIPDVLSVSNALNAGIGLQYNIGGLWKTGAKVQSAKARNIQLQAAEGIINDQIKLEVNNAYQQYLLALRKIDVYKNAVLQADENYRITKNKYDNNLVTTTELLDADVAQLQAQLNYAYAYTDATLAYKKLQKASGLLK